MYWVYFLVMPHSAFEVALGLKFVDTYAVCVSTKAYGAPSSGPRLGLLLLLTQLQLGCHSAVTLPQSV